MKPMKKTSAIVVLLAFLLLAGMIVSPASAYYKRMDIQPADGGTCLNFQDGVCVDNTGIIQNKFNGVTTVSFGNGTNVISVVNIYAPIGTTVNFTAHYGNGLSVAGYTVYSSVVPLSYSKSEIMLGGVYAYQDFIDFLQAGKDREILGYASNMSEAGEVISQGFMLYTPGIVGETKVAYYPVSGGFAANLITRIDITSNQPIDVLILTDSAENTVKLADFTSKNQFDTGTEWINFIAGISGAIFGFVLGIFWIIKFFFIDNLLLIIAIWISVSMAYSAISTRDIFKFYTKFFRLQRALLDFIVSLWTIMVSIVGTMVQTFLKWL